MRPLGRTSPRTVTTGERTKGPLAPREGKRPVPCLVRGCCFRRERRAGGLPLEPRPGRGDGGTFVGSCPSRFPSTGRAEGAQDTGCGPSEDEQARGHLQGEPRGAALRRGNAQPGGLQGRPPPAAPVPLATSLPGRREGGSMESLNPTSHRGLLPAGTGTEHVPRFPHAQHSPQVTSLLGPRASVAPTAPSAASGGPAPLSSPAAGSLRAVLAPAPTSWVPWPAAHTLTPPLPGL